MLKFHVGTLCYQNGMFYVLKEKLYPSPLTFPMVLPSKYPPMEDDSADRSILCLSQPFPSFFLTCRKLQQL